MFQEDQEGLAQLGQRGVMDIQDSRALPGLKAIRVTQGEEAETAPMPIQGQMVAPVDQGRRDS